MKPSKYVGSFHFQDPARVAPSFFIISLSSLESALGKDDGSTLFECDRVRARTFSVAPRKNRRATHARSIRHVICPPKSRQNCRLFYPQYPTLKHMILTSTLYIAFQRKILCRHRTSRVFRCKRFEGFRRGDQRDGTLVKQGEQRKATIYLCICFRDQKSKIKLNVALVAGRHHKKTLFSHTLRETNRRILCLVHGCLPPRRKNKRLR